MKVQFISFEDQVKQCRVCVHSRPIAGVTTTLACRHHGFVASDYCCRRFSVDIMSVNVRRRRKLMKRPSAEDFSID